MVYPGNGTRKGVRMQKGTYAILGSMIRMLRALIVLGMVAALFGGDIAAHAGLLDDIKREIQEKEEEIRRLEEEKKRFAQTIGQKQNAQRTLKNEIARLTAEAEKLRVQQRITEQNISSTELSILALEAQIRSLEEELGTQRVRIITMLRALQEQAEEHRTLFALVLRAGAVSSFLGQLASAEKIGEALYEQLQALVRSRESLAQENEALKKKEQALEDLQGRLAAERGAKDAQQKQKNALLGQTKNEEKKFQSLLTEAEKKRQEILKDIKELEDKLRRTIDPASLPAFRPGVLEWPVRGIVSQEYGSTKDTGFQNDAYEFHNGIDVADDIGTPIRAARDGVVQAVGNNSPYAYGKWIAIDHGNNLTTLYAHLSGYAASMKQGSAVKKGQVMAYMGATGFATGPHLHFTVYASNTFITQQRWFGLLPLGGSINPRNYLP